MQPLAIFFTSMALLTGAVTAAYAAYAERRVFVPILLTAMAVLCINLAWQACLLFVLPLIWVTVSKVRYSSLMACCMIPAVALAYLLLKIFLLMPPTGLLLLATAAVGLISAIGILGIFEESLVHYLLLSNAAQITFVVADLAVAAAAGKLEILGTVQIFNYTFAGLLLFLTLGILSAGGARKIISRLSGGYWASAAVAIGAIIAALSLAGLPGLNIFVAEWYLFITAYALNPLITLLGIFAALILFIMYFKIAYILLVGETAKAMAVPKLLTGIAIALTASVIVFGLIPQTQLALLVGLV
jgi:formate hydrogenlyase subunit 3/multisubunit Na+/H+ antiporter MnhD subunit